MKSKIKNEVFVVGHKNPDTDSICSAIAYARLKNLLSDKKHYTAKRAGMVNAETEYVLSRFGAEEPALLSNVRLQVADIDINRLEGVSADTSIRDAWFIMKQNNVYTLAITEENKLQGVISTGDIAMSYMEIYDNRILSTANTRYSNILGAVDGQVIAGIVEGRFVEGKALVAASSPDLMEAIIKKGDLVICGNRYEVQLCAIESEAGCVIICGENKIEESIKQQAEMKNIIIMQTMHDPLTAARLINQAIPIRYFMKKDGLTIFQTSDYIDEIKQDITKDRARDFPVVDKNKDFYGFISSRRLMEATKKELVLVDHNEKTQAVDGIEEAEILEIIDHHRLGGLETIGPVYFRNHPVGCTATIVYNMYRENNISLDQTTAALLCAAIISDTLLFRSPTATIVDEMAAKELSKIAGIDCQELAGNMFRAGSNLKGKTAEEICFQDFKPFSVGNVKFGVGQINSMEAQELLEIKEVLYPYLETAAKIHQLDMVFFMLTNILEEKTEILYYGKEAKLQLQEAYRLIDDSEIIELPGVVSRKKQFIPTFVGALQKSSS